MTSPTTNTLIVRILAIDTWTSNRFRSVLSLARTVCSTWEKGCPPTEIAPTCGITIIPSRSTAVSARTTPDWFTTVAMASPSELASSATCPPGVVMAPLLLTAPANAPFNNAQEFFLAARNAGDKWSYGTPGVGTVGHIGMELLKTKTNINPVHVPYPGNPQVINAMIGGQIHLSLLPPGLAAAQIRAGKLKAVGVCGVGYLHAHAAGQRHHAHFS